MKLAEYIKNLQHIVEKNPEYSNLVVLEFDNDSSYYNEVDWYPSVGNFDGKNEFISEISFQEHEDHTKGGNVDYEPLTVNAVCIN